VASLHLALTLESDVVLSRRAATIGGHETLKSIPGAALLGAVACSRQGGRTLYDRLGDDAFRAFHSGEVRFGCGWPDDGTGRPAYSIPRSLHRLKRPAAVRPGADPKEGTDLVNLAVGTRPTGVQLLQQRGGFVGPDGQLAHVATRYSMRTAVGDQGQASAGLLFGYEAISAGQRFLARIDADDAALLDRIGRELFGERDAVTLAVGRSRSAEFGRVRAERFSFQPWPIGDGHDGRIVVLVVTDTALRDEETGQPRLLPRGEDFGLPGWVVDDERTFLRTRAWSPFHGKRRRPDLERQVIEAGSVVVLARSGGSVDTRDVDEAREATAAGVGDWREEGLGQVLVQPTLLATPAVRVKRAPGIERPEVAIPADALGAWVRARADEQALRAEADARATALVRELGWTARGGKRIPASQWGELRRLAFRASARDREARPPDLLAEVKDHVGEKKKAEAAPVGQPRQPGKMYGMDPAQPEAGRGPGALRWSACKRSGRTAGAALVARLEDVPDHLRAPVLERLAARLAALTRTRREEGE